MRSKVCARPLRSCTPTWNWAFWPACSPLCRRRSGAGGGGKAVGLISGDTYPQMDDFILPGFRAGVRYVNPDIPVRYAVVGNWADPSTANELAQNMYAANTAIIFAVAAAATRASSARRPARPAPTPSASIRIRIPRRRYRPRQRVEVHRQRGGGRHRAGGRGPAGVRLH